jgi:hypothetical protein
MDVHNGILLAERLQTAFQNHDIAIYINGDTFVVHTQPTIVTPDLRLYNGKILKFPNGKRTRWPREEFLKFHNSCFEDRGLLLEAQV